MINFSRKLYIASHLKVTVNHTGIQALNLKFDTAFLAYLTVQACPAINDKCSCSEEKSLFHCLIYVQIHIFNTTFSNLGTSITLETSNFSFKAGAISFKYFSLSIFFYK
ncbi:MAG: hypothetical protein Q8S84_03915 [bacterium]|nr:hypothetical protein [bacterium]MDP3380660.1 hypothetical protein [bacterium]